MPILALRLGRHFRLRPEISVNERGQFMTSNQKPTLLRLYGIRPYDRSGKVRWLMTELGLEFEDRWLDREKKEHEGAEFLKINPLGRIPVLEVDDQVIFESGAICSYLADRYPERKMAPPVSARERADYLKWMYFAASTLDVFQTRIMIIEDIPPGEIQATKERALQADLQDALEALDRVFVKDQFLVGNRFSTADICVSYHLYWCKLWPELSSVMQRFPRVGEYVERMKKMPSAVQSKVFSYQE